MIENVGSIQKLNMFAVQTASPWGEAPDRTYNGWLQ